MKDFTKVLPKKDKRTILFKIYKYGKYSGNI